MKTSARLLMILFVAARSPSEDGAWRQAVPGYVLKFPSDHGSHPDYRIEWWYYTGNLTGVDGSRYGYQLTFFRIGVEFQPVNPSRWSVRDLFMAHLAVTDITGGTHRFEERLSRAGPGWAGAGTGGYHVWNGTWSARLDGADNHRLLAMGADIGLDLVLSPGKGPTLHGRSGYSPKGSQAGNATYYYSFSRMPTRGRLAVSGRSVEVEGDSWMDHEFGTSFLEEQQVGWDWFSIQLEDGRDLMLFQLRRKDGLKDPHSSGTLIGNARTESITHDEFELIPGRIWKSRASGASYPVEWRIRIPKLGIELQIRAALEGQELRTGRSTGVNYWEGAVTVQGGGGSAPVRGRGYLEMTGYSGAPISRVLR